MGPIIVFLNISLIHGAALMAARSCTARGGGRPVHASGAAPPHPPSNLLRDVVHHRRHHRHTMKPRVFSLSALAAAVASATLAAATDFKILPDTDFSNIGGGPASPAVKGKSGVDCANSCLKLPGCAAVVWNSGGDHGCNFKCNAEGKLTKKGEEAVIVRPGKDFCKNPPPPKPPPTAAMLCPKATMPSDWFDSCMAGDLFYQSGADAATKPGSTTNLMPTIGNGYLSTFVLSDIIFAAGLFNGDSLGAKGPVSHRAAIPAYHVALPRNGTTLLHRALDVRRAVFIQRSTVVDSGGVAINVEERFYTPLHKPSLLVHEMNFTTAGKAAVVPGLGGTDPDSGMKTADLNLTKQRPMMGGPLRWLGENKVGELDNKTQLAMLVTDHGGMEPRHVTPAAPVVLQFLTCIVTSLNSSDSMQDATKLYRTSRGTDLFTPHAAEWAARWEAGSLEAEGDLNLAQALNGSLYAVRSAIRPDMPYGLSPGGLASNAYEGHTFWDQETVCPSHAWSVG